MVVSGCIEALIEGMAETGVLLVLDIGDALVGKIVGDKFLGFIGTPVVDDDELPLVIGLLHQAQDGPTDERALVVSGHQDGKTDFTHGLTLVQRINTNRYG